ncbi:uncharacterized protein LOC131942641 [Physella acuta]|uniref:uncharacterized protein LOC131942641 n=1 Tax=Physella acuta TaxID=109671 RepID=UPI0027DAC597|nr:uncharacterized protein LOC131942641 [Physella acuta]
MPGRYSGLSVQELVNIRCPSEKPNICLRYGVFCRLSEFCSADVCESCFPLEAKADLLGWCRTVGQHNVSHMRHAHCRLACQDIYTSDMLSEKRSINNQHNISSAAVLIKDTDVSSLSRFEIIAILSLAISLLCVVSMAIWIIIFYWRHHNNKTMSASKKGPTLQGHVRVGLERMDSISLREHRMLLVDQAREGNTPDDRRVNDVIV